MHICRLTGSRHGFELILQNSLLIDSNDEHWFTHTFTRKGNKILTRVFWGNCPLDMSLPDPKQIILYARGLPVEVLSYEITMDPDKTAEEDQIETLVHETKGITLYALGDEFRQGLITKYLKAVEKEYDHIDVHDYKQESPIQKFLSERED
jgi:hypothetical protein